MEKFQYQSIEPPHEIRMLELIPGTASAPIQVHLVHKSLSHMQQCIALSYVWGAGTRDFEIICDGAILKVTENLVEVLERFRKFQKLALDHIPDSNQLNITERTLFWIDAICINQEDLDERSQQVPLMSTIYKNASRVIVWLGEELPRSQEAWDLMAPLAGKSEQFKIHANDENKERYGSTIICPGLMLKDLSKHPAFCDILDIFSSRALFMRLWTIQETCLAPSTQITVLCGGVEMPWEAFSDISMILFRCFRFWDFKEDEKVSRNAILMNAYLRRLVQAEVPFPQQELLELFGLSTMAFVLDERDRVFGVLGLFDEDTRKRFSSLGYRNEAEEIFRAVTEAIVSTGRKGLEYLTWNHAVRGDHRKLVQPSWVWILSYWNLKDHLTGSKLKDLKEFETPHKAVISGDTIIAWGLVFDTVTVAYPNFSSENFEDILLNIHFTILAEIKEAEIIDAERKLDRLKKVLFRLTFGTLKGAFDPQEQYEGWMARVILREWEKSTSKNESSDTWRGILLSTLRKKTALRFESLDRLVQDDTLRRDYNEQLTGEGRNIFVTSKGYFGIGAYGKNKRGSSPAVQVNDKIAIIPGVEQPLVLRACGNGEYKFVGPSLVPEIEMNESLQVENRKPMGVIRIV
ncbi:heterokaryon incompatibility protein [Botrytis cinerea]